MSRPIPNNVTLSTQKTTNTAAASSAYTHPSGHALTFYADGTIWDDTADKALLPQDLKRN